VTRIAVLLNRYTPEERARREAAIRASVPAGVEVGCLEMADVAGGSALTDYHRSAVAPLVARAAADAEAAGYEALVTWGTLDLGVEESRHVVDIPVVGPGRISVATAAIVVDRIGVICHGTLQQAMFRKLVRHWGMESRIVGIAGAGVAPEVITDPDPAAVLDGFRVESEKLIAAGAQAIVPLGLSMVPVAIPAREVAAAVGVPVLDPLAIALRYAEALAATGTGNSRVAYPKVHLEARA
jgi:allantoin racemase